MSASHGHRTMGGKEYDDGGCVENTKKEKVSMRGVGIAMQRMH